MFNWSKKEKSGLFKWDDNLGFVPITNDARDEVCKIVDAKMFGYHSTIVELDKRVTQSDTSLKEAVYMFNVATKLLEETRALLVSTQHMIKDKKKDKKNDRQG